MSHPSTSNPAIVQVAIASPLYRLFDYLPAAGGSIQCHPLGSRVLVPFGKREVVGIVAGHQPQSELAIAQLKCVIKPLGSRAALEPPQLKLAHWLADYYHHPLGDVLFNMLPNALRKPVIGGAYTERCWQISTHGLGLPATALARAPKQQALLNMLRSEPERWTSDRELIQSGHAQQAALQLHKKELLHQTQKEYLPHDCPSVLQGKKLRDPLTLNEEQATVLAQIRASQGQGAVSLIEGVTGSGKTEVYLQAISDTLAQGKQAVVLVPEIGLTPQTIGRFVERFNCKIAVFHSGLSDKERLAAWQASRDGEVDIIIGTRSAVFTPCPRPGLFIVDEEHDNSYKQQDGLHYSARDVAVMRGHFEQAPVILGSATPSLETLHNAQQKKYQYCVLTQRAGGAVMPSVTFIDIRKLPLHEGLSDTAIQAIADTLQAGRQAMVFINRRGFAPLLICHDCGWYANCNHCDARLTLHQRARRLRCHHCDFSTAIPSHCPRCQSAQLLNIGQGTERSTETLARLFPNTEILRIDRDTTRSKSSLDNSIQRINEQRPLIMVGTQMLAKGHHFTALDTVVMLDVDQGLYNPDFRGAEKTLQLMEQVAGRAGRSTQSGKVFIQTHLPDHPLVRTWAEHGFKRASEDMLQERHTLGLPPYTYMALLRADSRTPEHATSFLHGIQRSLNAQIAGTHVQAIGPMPALMERRAGRHRAQLLFKSTHRKPLHSLLEATLMSIATGKTPSGLRWSIDVDPQESV